MATSKGYHDGQPLQSPRPSRVRRIPGHLEDYELSHPLQTLQPTITSTVPPMISTYASPLNTGGFHPQPMSTYQTYESTDDRLQRLEARWQTMRHQMREMEAEMDNVRLTPHHQGSFTHPAYQSMPYTPYMPQYNSLPYLERVPLSSSPTGISKVQSASHIASQMVSLSQDQGAAADPTTQAAPSATLTEDHGADSVPPLAALDQAAPVSLTLPAQPVPPVYMIPPPPTSSLVLPAVSTVPATPIQTIPALPQPAYSAPSYWQPSPQPYVAPPVQYYYPQQHPAPVRPPDNSNAPGVLEMVIASSYGIPKPKLTVFSSGRESDFLLLKKGLDSVLGPHRHLSEDYKYQVLLDHLRFPAALQIAKRFINSATPYHSAMQALMQRYGQPRQLVQGELNAILNAPAVKAGDYQGIEDFAAAVGTLVGMLSSMQGPSAPELLCGSHVDTLLSKLPVNFRDSFAEYCFTKGIIQSGSDRTYTLPDLAEWLERKVQTLQVSRRLSACPPDPSHTDSRERRTVKQPRAKSATILLGNHQGAQQPNPAPTTSPPLQSKKRDRFKPYCPFCNNQEHYLNTCVDFAKLANNSRADWIKEKKRCWRCGRGHTPDDCTLKKPCSTCGEQHLSVLHDVARTANVLTMNASPSTVYMDQISHSGRVMLKVVPVCLHNGKKTFSTYAVLDDGSERTVILPAVMHHLGLKGTEEVLTLRTIRQDKMQVKGATVSLKVSSIEKKRMKHDIHHAFTAAELSLAEQSCAVELLKRKYKHLRDIPLHSFNKVKPMLLIGSDNPHLITPQLQVRSGPIGGPVAVYTALGWAVQGPANFLQYPSEESSCLHTSFLSPSEELHQNVERLWKLDTLPFRNNKEVIRSGEDKVAMEQLEQQTIRVNVDGVSRYATPLLRKPNAQALHAPPTAVMALLRATERRLANNAEQAAVYNEEIHKLEKAGYVVKINEEEVSSSKQSWFLPHHLVYHNGKARVVFNCSFNYKQACLNDNLLPGPTLSASLLGVLLRFREHAVAISGDIRGMFHQVRLLPDDQPLLRFLWRNGEKERSSDVYEWLVLPFGTTCSPCCATYALQRHVQDHSEGNEDVVKSVLQAFYVDNCLQSLPSPEEARQLIDRMRALLASGGFDMRQWSSNMPEVIAHLPPEAKSTECELWLTANKTDPQESTLGLLWRCRPDALGYKPRIIPVTEPTMRYVYRVLASQYDPLGYIVPYTTRAKVLVQALWRKERGWDEPIADNLLPVWQEWERELPQLRHITLPRRYFSDVPPDSPVELHIFCDASEKAYGAVAYMRVKASEENVQVAFVMARSRVAPRKQLSIPRLELCAALSGAQLAKVLQTELTLPLQQTTLWTDSTTVLHWIQSESQQYKVFVGIRIAEIQELVGADNWRYVPSEENPADDITRGKSLVELTTARRWTCGPTFLHQSAEKWPTNPAVSSTPTPAEETRSTIFIGNITVSSTPSATLYNSWSELVDATYQALHGAAAPPLTAADKLNTEVAILQRSQQESFPAEVAALKAGKPLSPNSCLLSLSPVEDKAVGLIRVGGRLRKAETLEEDTIHPIILAPDHPVTKLLIQDYDNRLFHAGPDRVFAEIRRTYWILRGRQAVKKHQHSCTECRKWRSKPVIPQMADLPAARLRINQPPYWSTGVDCFGPYTIKIGRRHEKRWGVIFKCLTTRCVHLDLLCSMDTDSFLLALRRFIARRGKPYEILCDRGTNFRGGDRELQEAFAALEPALKDRLAEQSISFRFNPPLAPHFGGVWEREIKSVKASLQVVLKDQVLPEEVLMTVLIEVEGILNSKPLGYATSDIADPDPITPNLLLMGRRDASLPQAVYHNSDLLGRRRWKHSQVLADHFWVQFTKNYLPNLQHRRKWSSSTVDLTQDQVVMIIDPQLPRAMWPVGRITKVIPSDDGRIRTAEVDIKGSTYTRPVAKLIPLPAMPED